MSDSNNEREKVRRIMPGFLETVERDQSNYKSRCIGKTEIDGLVVSTAWTSDEGYETAILDAPGVHPVERYEGKKEALVGHEKWCDFVRKGGRDIVKLGGFGGMVQDNEMTLEPEAGR